MKHLIRAAMLASLIALMPPPANALLSRDLTEKFDDQQATAWSFGALDMYAFLNPDRAKCALDWWDNKGGLEITYLAMEKYPDKRAAAILYALIKRECGPE